VVGIKLAAKSRVSAALVAPAAAAAPLALVTVAGYAKRTPLADFPTQGRGGQGVVAAKLNDKSGEVAGVALLGPDDLLICGFAKSLPKTVPAADLPEMGRSAAGKPVTALLIGEPVRAVYAVAGGGASRAAREAPPAAAPKAAGGPATRGAAGKPRAKAAPPAAEPPTTEAVEPSRRKATSVEPPAPAEPSAQPRSAAAASAGTPASASVEKPARGKAKDEAQQLSLIPPAVEPAVAPTVGQARRKSAADPETAKPAAPASRPAEKAGAASRPAKPAAPADKPAGKTRTTGKTD
jgi:DNA gyrase subunit A